MSEKHICKHCGMEITGICRCNIISIDYGVAPKGELKIEPVKPTEPAQDFKMPSLDDLSFSMEFTLTDEQLAQFNKLFSFDVSRFIGTFCIICHQPFTQEYFDNGGLITRHGKTWVHDTCLPSNN